MKSLIELDISFPGNRSLRWRESAVYLNTGNPAPHPNAAIHRRERARTDGEIEVVVTQPALTAEEIRRLAQEAKVTALILGDSQAQPAKSVQLDDAAVQALAQFTQLEVLALHGETNFTDDFAKVVLTLPKLRELRLESRVLTDATLGYISRHPVLESIGVSSPAFTKAGLKPLLARPSLLRIEVNSPRGKVLSHPSAAE